MIGCHGFNLVITYIMYCIQWILYHTMSYDVVHSICELKLPTEYKKEWREVHEDCKQAANKQIQELAKHKKDFFHHLNTMSEQYDKHMHLVSVTTVYSNGH